MTERPYPIEKISLLQFREIQKLNSSDYTRMKNSIDIENDFHIRIYDINKNQTFLDYGDNPPERGDVVALQRYVIYQNSTADIENGRLTIQVW